MDDVTIPTAPVIHVWEVSPREAKPPIERKTVSPFGAHTELSVPLSGPPLLLGVRETPLNNANRRSA